VGEIQEKLTLKIPGERNSGAWRFLCQSGKGAIMQRLDSNLSDREISALCDVSQAPGWTFNQEKRRDISRLIDRGYVKRCDDEAPIFQLTRKGSRALTERGAGLNEA
jgi:hypothetical protein